jgi:IS1 family transposase
VNVLSLEQQTKIISMLLEGCSIRAVERLTGNHRSSIIALSRRVGIGCGILHNRRVRDLVINRLEVDEVWALVGKREKRRSSDDPQWTGAQYTSIALAESSRLIITYCTGKRTPDVTSEFIEDLKNRLIGTPEISSDGYAPYVQAIREFFGQDAPYGQVLKSEQFYTPKHKKQHLPRNIGGTPAKKVVKSGNPARISTSYVERQNLTIRMGCARFRRASNSISKSIENHVAAVAMYVAFYNFVRPHESLRTTPAVAQGLEDMPWSLEKLIITALELSDECRQRTKSDASCTEEEGPLTRWFRFYDDVVNDPKVQRLDPKLFKSWVNILCLASKNDGWVPHIDDVMFHLRLSEAEAGRVTDALVSSGLLDEFDGRFTPHNWKERQFKSDVSTERVKRFRQQQRIVSVTPNETPPETEQITDTEQNREERARKRGVRLDPGWKPSPEDASEAVRKLGGPLHAEQELLKFHDYWKAQPGQRGVKLDWDATWRNWIRNAKGQPNGRRTVHDAANDLINRVQALDEPAPSSIRGGEGQGAVRLLPAR